jgi:DNA mismatch repair protein MutS
MSTPLTRQYDALKQQVPDALLFFRLGNFYTLFFEDATLARRELAITLNKEHGRAGIPMLSIPYKSADAAIARLLQKGHRVAVCDQAKDHAPEAMRERPRSVQKLHLLTKGEG